jgi:hypothetical protein
VMVCGQLFDFFKEWEWWYVSQQGIWFLKARNRITLLDPSGRTRLKNICIGILKYISFLCMILPNINLCFSFNCLNILQYFDSSIIIEFDDIVKPSYIFKILCLMIECIAWLNDEIIFQIIFFII